MIFGFTGTRGKPPGSGMNEIQREIVRGLIVRFAPIAVHHGDCIGADAQFHDIVRAVSSAIKIYIHPCDIEAQRAHCKGDVEYLPKSPLLRNTDIVLCAEALIATPHEHFNVARGSGTWSTIRAARRTGTPRFIIYPDGSIGG